MNSRYHCGEEMRYLGQNKQGHGFECDVCQELEYSIDPNKPTTPDEVPRKSFLSYGTETMIPKL